MRATGQTYCETKVLLLAYVTMRQEAEAWTSRGLEVERREDREEPERGIVEVSELDADLGEGRREDTLRSIRRYLVEIQLGEIRFALGQLNLGQYSEFFEGQDWDDLRTLQALQQSSVVELQNIAIEAGMPRGHQIRFERLSNAHYRSLAVEFRPREANFRPRRGRGGRGRGRGSSRPPAYVRNAPGTDRLVREEQKKVLHQ